MSSYLDHSRASDMLTLHADLEQLVSDVLAGRLADDWQAWRERAEQCLNALDASRGTLG